MDFQNMIVFEFAFSVCSVALLILISVTLRSINKHLEKISGSVERHEIRDLKA